MFSEKQLMDYDSDIVTAVRSSDIKRLKELCERGRGKVFYVLFLEYSCLSSFTSQHVSM